MKLPEERIKIKKGQVWRKKDTNMTAYVAGKDRSDRVKMQHISHGQKTHSVRKRDLLMFWKKI